MNPNFREGFLKTAFAIPLVGALSRGVAKPLVNVAKLPFKPFTGYAKKHPLLTGFTAYDIGTSTAGAVGRGSGGGLTNIPASFYGVR